MEDRGFFYGDGAFETIRIHRGAPFRFDRHLLRLAQSLQTLGLPAPSTHALRTAAETLVRAARLVDGLLRITVTAPDPGKGHPGHVVLTHRSLPAPPKRVVLHVAEDCSRVAGPLSRAKTLSRALEAKALREAREAGAFDALLMDPAGRIIETTSRNVFLVVDDVLRTPSVEEGALPGITREAVLEGARDLGIPTRQEPIPRGDLPAANEFFLTGSGVGVLGVARVSSIEYGPVPGPWTARVAEAYRRLLERESTWNR